MHGGQEGKKAHGTRRGQASVPSTHLVLVIDDVDAAVGGRNLKYPPIAISVASYDAKDIDFISISSSLTRLKVKPELLIN